MPALQARTQKGFLIHVVERLRTLRKKIAKQRGRYASNGLAAAIQVRISDKEMTGRFLLLSEAGVHCAVSQFLCIFIFYQPYAHQ